MRRAAARLGTVIVGAIDELFPRAVEVDAEGRRHDPLVIDPATAYCGRCGASTGPGGGCGFCAGSRIAWDALTRLGAYAPPLDGHIREMKFGRQWRWAPWLGDRLAEALPRWEAQAVVVPVPMSWRRRWRRGYNQSDLIAEAVGKSRGWPLAPVLHRTRHTSPQTSVTFSDRERNVAGSFAVAPIDLSGWVVVLVDDVKTSGSTLAACSRLLRKAGADRIHVAVAAVADPKGADFTRIDA